MLTGDNKTTAQAVARRLGITEVEAEVLPDQKSAVVERLRREGRVVAMAGDGVNDAPALAAAEVGIAMGTGTDVAIESAGITLLKGDLTGIVRARRLSAATMGNIRQNLFFAFIYNAAGVPIAAGVLYPTFGILLSPIIAAAAMALSSVSVVGNALRLAARAALAPAVSSLASTVGDRRTLCLIPAHRPVLLPQVQQHHTGRHCGNERDNARGAGREVLQCRTRAQANQSPARTKQHRSEHQPSDRSAAAAAKGFGWRRPGARGAWPAETRAWKPPAPPP